MPDLCKPESFCIQQAPFIRYVAYRWAKIYLLIICSVQFENTEAIYIKFTIFDN